MKTIKKVTAHQQAIGENVEKIAREQDEFIEAAFANIIHLTPEQAQREHQLIKAWQKEKQVIKDKYNKIGFWKGQEEELNALDLKYGLLFDAI